MSLGHSVCKTSITNLTQYCPRNGVFGGIIINGPASAPYDEDLGTITLNDWYHETPESLYSFVLANGPPNATSGLINGTGVYMNSTGIRFEAIFEPGKRYRLRIINAALSAGWKFMIDNHYLTVIATDFVPIVPYNTTSVNIAMGQRYDLVIAADQRADRDYCMCHLLFSTSNRLQVGARTLHTQLDKRLVEVVNTY